MNLLTPIQSENNRAVLVAGRVLLALVAAALILALVWLAPSALDAFNEMLARGFSSVSNPHQ